MSLAWVVLKKREQSYDADRRHGYIQVDVYVQHIEEDKSRDIDEYNNKKSKTGMSWGIKKVVRISHNFKNKKVMHLQLLVHLFPKTEVSLIARIHRTSSLDHPNPTVMSRPSSTP